MAKFHFQTARAGGTSAGVLEAADLNAAAALLRARGETIVDLAPLDLPTELVRARFSLASRPSIREVANFTSQLAVMIRAGISIRHALEAIAEQTEHQSFRKVLMQMRGEIENGGSFSQALSRHPQVFSPLYVNMVKASEMTGGLAGMLDRIGGYLNQQLETRALIVGAMTYPAIIAMMAITTTIFLLVFVLPRFMILFAGKEAALPLATRVLIALSHFLVRDWGTVVAVALALASALVFTARTSWGQLKLDRLKLRVPLLARMFRALYISRSLHTMGQLVNAGVPILDTLSITADVSGNAHYRHMWRRVYGAVKEGRRIALPLHACDLLPRAVVQMISAGEETGRLGEVLDGISEYYARELKSVIKTATSLIEPAMILLMGGIVGFIAASIILPIFKLSQIMGR